MRITKNILLMALLCSTQVNATIYEDAEDGNTNKWRVYNSSQSGVHIKNVHTDSINNNIIEFDAEGISNINILGNLERKRGAWHNTTEKTIKWDMSFSKNFIIFLRVMTVKGARYIYYTNNEKSFGKNNEYIHIGLGKERTNGKWQTITRNLETDLQKYEPKNSITAVNAFLIRGNGLVDNIELIAVDNTTHTNPKFLKNDIYDITPRGAKLNIVSDKYVKTYIEYGIDTNYGQVIEEKSFDYKNHVENFKNLKSNTMYHYKITSTDKTGKSQISPDKQFTTLKENSQSSQTHVKVAIIGDQGYNTKDDGGYSRDILDLVKSKGTDLLVINGDFDYISDPDFWENTLLKEHLGADFPIVPIAGNHDIEKNWDGYKAAISRMWKNAKSKGLTCKGTPGEESVCTFKNIQIVSVAPEYFDKSIDDSVDYINANMSNSMDKWKICSWHETMSQMQLGSKDGYDRIGWGMYEACRKKGAIVTTGHNHAYGRTHLLSSMSDTPVIASTSNIILMQPGKTFVALSGMGGTNDQNKSDGMYANAKWWAKTYSKSDDTDELSVKAGVLFCDFGQDDTKCEYVAIVTENGIEKNKVIDSFTLYKNQKNATTNTSSLLPKQEKYTSEVINIFERTNPNDDGYGKVEEELADKNYRGLTVGRIFTTDIAGEFKGSDAYQVIKEYARMGGKNNIINTLKMDNNINYDEILDIIKNEWKKLGREDILFKKAQDIVYNNSALNPAIASSKKLNGSALTTLNLLSAYVIHGAKKDENALGTDDMIEVTGNTKFNNHEDEKKWLKAFLHTREVEFCQDAEHQEAIAILDTLNYLVDQDNFELNKVTIEDLQNKYESYNMKYFNGDNLDIEKVKERCGNHYKKVNK